MFNLFDNSINSNQTNQTANNIKDKEVNRDNKQSNINIDLSDLNFDLMPTKNQKNCLINIQI